MQTDKELLLDRIVEGSTDLTRYLVESYVEQDENARFDNIGMANVINAIVVDLITDDSKMNELVQTYLSGIRDGSLEEPISYPRDHYFSDGGVTYRDYGTYALMRYDLDLHAKVGDIIVVKMASSTGETEEVERIQLEVIKAADENTSGIATVLNTESTVFEGDYAFDDVCIEQIHF